MVATPRRYVEPAVAICGRRRLNAASVTPSALAAGRRDGAGRRRNTLVLSVGPAACGADLAAGRRRRRHPPPAGGGGPQPQFVNETAPGGLVAVPAPARAGELVLWDGRRPRRRALGEQLGLRSAAASCGRWAWKCRRVRQRRRTRSRRRWPWLCRALGRNGRRPSISCTPGSPPRRAAAPAVGVLAAARGRGCSSAARSTRTRTSTRQARPRRCRPAQDHGAVVAAADSFVSKVTFAQAWHGGDPRYLACVRDLTARDPGGRADVRHEPRRPGVRRTSAARRGRPPARRPRGARTTRTLAGLLYGKTSDQEHVQVLDRDPTQSRAFSDVKLGGTRTPAAAAR